MAVAEAARKFAITDRQKRADTPTPRMDGLISLSLLPFNLVDVYCLLPLLRLPHRVCQSKD